MTPEQVTEYQRKSSQAEYENIRSEPLICELIKQIHDRKIDTGKYPYVVPKVEAVKKGTKAKKGAKDEGTNEFERNDVIDNPRIFVFVIGGLSHHEIVSIANLQESLNAQVIPGANEIIKPGELMNQLQKLHKKENDIAFIRNLNSKEKTGTKGKQLIDEDDDNEDTNDDNYAINA